MNRINIEATKVTIPLITDDELDAIDNNLHSIIDNFLKHKIRDKDLYLAQYIMKKLEEENQELKKLLEKAIQSSVADHKYASKCEDRVITMEAQQKEFIKYLEDEILISMGYTRTIYEDILSKYKEIIGSNTDVFR